MKTWKFSLFAAIAMTAAFAFGDADDLRVIFSTQGPDCYADGTTVVADGEWYALVWLKGSTFYGVDTTLHAVNEDNEVALAAPLAKDGKCPPVLFLVDSAKKKTSGTYRVYLLDTRGVDGKPSAADANGNPLRVNAVCETSAAAAANAEKSTLVVNSTTAVASYVETDVSSIANPTIEAFDVVGDQALITVSGMDPSVNYVITKGAELSSLSSTDVVIGAANNGVVIPVNKEDARFFSVGRKPIK